MRDRIERRLVKSTEKVMKRQLSSGIRHRPCKICSRSQASTAGPLMDTKRVMPQTENASLYIPRTSQNANAQALKTDTTIMSFSLTKVASKTTPISRKPESITSIFAQPNSRGFPALPNELYLEILSYYPSHPVPPHRLDTKEEKEYAIQRYPTLLSLCHTCRSLRRFFLRYLWERVEIRPVDSSSSSSSSDGASVSEEGLGLGLGFGLGVHPTINAGQTFDGMTTLPFPGLSKAPRAVVCISESDDGTKAQQWTRKVTNERRAEILSSQLSVLLEENPSSRVATEYVRYVRRPSQIFLSIFRN